MQDQGFCARKFDDIPENYTAMAEEQMEIFPHLKEAIIQCNITGNETCISAPLQDHNKANDYFQYTCMDIEYQNDYFEIGLYWVD